MRLSSVAASLVALAFGILHTQPVMAGALFFSASGSGSTCSQSAPCTLQQAVITASIPMEELSCADSSDNGNVTINKPVIIDCAGTAGSISGAITINPGVAVVLRNFTSWHANGITFLGAALVMENIHFVGSVGPAILIEPIGSTTVVIKNCIFDLGDAGPVLSPGGGGSVSARFDHVTIAGNNGGGLKLNTNFGPVTVDVTDSEISSNSGNGLNAVSGPGGPAVFNIHNSVIAKNGAVGVQVNGAMAAAMIDTTLLDSNATGATSVVAGGHMLTYGNNRIVGPAGSSFTGSASLQ